METHKNLKDPKKRYPPVRAGLDCVHTATSMPGRQFLVLSCVEKGKSFTNVSPFVISKAINCVLGPLLKAVKKLRDGTLLVECLGDGIAKFKNIHLINGMPVSVELHKSLNTSRGVITCFDLLHVTMEECKTELLSEGVIDCVRINRKVNGEMKPSTSMIVTFNTSDLPERLRVGFHILKVRPYIPSPMRCYKCQRFGHISAR